MYLGHNCLFFFHIILLFLITVPLITLYDSPSYSNVRNEKKEGTVSYLSFQIICSRFREGITFITFLKCIALLRWEFSNVHQYWHIFLEVGWYNMGWNKVSERKSKYWLREKSEYWNKKKKCQNIGNLFFLTVISAILSTTFV